MGEYVNLAGKKVVSNSGTTSEKCDLFQAFKLVCKVVFGTSY